MNDAKPQEGRDSYQQGLAWLGRMMLALALGYCIGRGHAEPKRYRVVIEVAEPKTAQPTEVKREDES